MYNIGDIVYFTTRVFDFKIGLIVSKNEDKYVVLDKSVYGLGGFITTDNVYSLEEKDHIISLMSFRYYAKIENLKKKLKPIKRSFYTKEIEDKYYRIKQDIINTALKMSDDEDFEDRLKAICEKKKNLFSIKCEECNDARKENGEIKYRIRELESDLAYTIDKLDSDLRFFKANVIDKIEEEE